MNILHISDVHFGIGDEKAEQPRIIVALAEAAQSLGIAPDFCIFSGDLANAGTDSQFADGERWLRELLLENWNSKLVIVPGNHDVDRQATSPNLFRAIAQDPKIYNEWAQAEHVNYDHLAAFFKWYKGATTRLPLYGEWRTPFGFHFHSDEFNIPVHILGLNSSMFCCDDDDKQHLVIDIKTLNSHLESANRHDGLVIAVAHHPLDHLAPWNREHVELLLTQERGAHLFLHGHLHEISARSKAESTGSGLTTLAAGAAYQDSKWPQSFAYYTLDFDRREISTIAFNYVPASGKWLQDNSKSRPIVTNLPLHRGALFRKEKIVTSSSKSTEIGFRSEASDVRDVPETHRGDDEGPAELSRSATSKLTDRSPSLLAPQADGTGGSPEKIREAALDLREAARDAQRQILQYFASIEPNSKRYYALKSRIKTSSRILEKYHGRKEANSEYKIDSMSDICGVRIITKYQDEIPGVVTELLGQIEQRPSTKIPLLPDRLINVVINNSRTETDSLSLVEPVRAICSLSRLRPHVEVKTHDTGYSSIHFIASVDTSSSECPVREMRVEIQIRSAFEDVWGEIDHELDYKIRRNDHKVPRNRHLSVLKSMIDAIISYVDVIKKQSDESSQKAVLESRRSRSISTPETQLKRLEGLPREMYVRVAQAFASWLRAYQSGEEQGNPDLFREGAKAFSDLLTEFRGQPSNNRRLADELAYVCQIEYAYMLQFTGENEGPKQAENVYVNILADRPNDAIANLRLGALYRKGQLLAESKAHLTRALQTILDGLDRDINASHWVYDTVRREIGLTEWRIAEDSQFPTEVRRDALLSALKYSHDVIVSPAVDDFRLNAINDFLYYYKWEAVQIGDIYSRFQIPEPEIEGYVQELFRYYSSLDRDELRYNQVDTLLRIYKDEPKKARDLALDLEFILERVVKKRRENLVLPEKGTIRWYGALIPELDRDERDALTFTQEALQRLGRHPIDK